MPDALPEKTLTLWAPGLMLNSAAAFSRAISLLSKLSFMPDTASANTDPVRIFALKPDTVGSVISRTALSPKVISPSPVTIVALAPGSHLMRSPFLSTVSSRRL